MTLLAEGLRVELGGRPVLDLPRFALEPGTVVGLLGPNGAGKSTLLRALAGLMACEGRVTLDGAPVASLAAEERARRIAYLPQDRVIGWPVAVRDLVGLGRLPWRAHDRAGPEAAAARIEAAMAMTDVGHLGHRPATELSGGEQARVVMARAIAQGTPVLLADEPAAGLDPAHQIAMMEALRRLAGEGRSILVSLHDLSLAARRCDRVAVLDRGKLAGDGSPDAVLTPDLLREVFDVVAKIDRDAGGLVLTPLARAGGKER